MPIAKISNAAGLAGEPLTPGCPALPGTLPALLQYSFVGIPKDAGDGHPHQALTGINNGH